ncbi:hypothetical protein J6590_019089 [Homalodisca vitripennis]|nr:hypothetical protein J6590_019089 [Homalodisca vitripennis]
MSFLVEVTLYIQAYNELNPRFTVGAWSPTDPTIRVAVAEEQPVGSTVIQLTAVDSPTDNTISHFTAVTPLPSGFALQSSGLVELTKVFDFENLDNKTFSFRVHAVSDDRLRKSEALVLFTIKDINDHAPQFPQQIYQGSVLESATNGTLVMNLSATDGDVSRTSDGFGDIRYSLSGENAASFVIDPVIGQIKVSESSQIDRERQAVLRLVVTAADMPQGGPSQRKTSVPVEIEVVDVNDNAPLFVQSHYSAVVLENVNPGTSVVNLTATDRDLGAGGEITYELVDQGEATGTI